MNDPLSDWLTSLGLDPLRLLMAYAASVTAVAVGVFITYLFSPPRKG